MIVRLFAAVLLAASLASPAFAQDPFTVLLDWFVNPDHAAIVVAKAGGYFDKAGLDVTLIEPADPSAPPRLVAAGQGDVALTYQPTFYAEVDEGLPLVRIGAAIATPLNSLIVSADGPVKRIADLKGKSIGYSIDGYEQVLLGAMLASDGLTLADVKLVNVNFALTQALVTGRVDAVIGAYRNFELTEMAQAGHPGRAFYPEEHGIPPYDELIYTVGLDKAKDPRFDRFLDAIEQATVYTLNHPDDAWALFIKAYPKLDDALNRQAWLDTLPRLAASPGAVDRRRYERMAQFMFKSGQIKTVQPIERYIGR